MKFKIILTSIFLSVLAQNAFAEIRDGFFINNFLTLEYSAPSITGNGANHDYKTNLFEKQIKNFENIAVGLHFRVHKYLGFNANYTKNALHSNNIADYGYVNRASYNLKHADFSAMFFLPLIEDSVLEAFTEVGVSDINGRLSISDIGTSVRKESHQTLAFIGLGAQFAPFSNSKDAFRLSFSRYLDKVGLIDANFTVVKLGYIKSF